VWAKPKDPFLTNDQFAFFREVVLWDLEIERGRPLSYAARDVVVGAVAGTEPTTVFAGFADGDTAEMCADTYGSSRLAYRTLKVLLSIIVFRDQGLR
jgi:hypothetical protein